MVDLHRGDSADTPVGSSPRRFADVVPAGGFCQRLAEGCVGGGPGTAGAARPRNPVRFSSRLLDLSAGYRGLCAGTVRNRRGCVVGCSGPRVLADVAKLVSGRCVGQYRPHPPVTLRGTRLAQTRRSEAGALPGGSRRVLADWYLRYSWHTGRARRIRASSISTTTYRHPSWCWRRSVSDLRARPVPCRS